MRKHQLGDTSLGLAAAVAVAVTIDVACRGPLSHLDHVVHRLADRHIRGEWKSTAETVFLLGQRWTLVNVMAPLAVIAAARARSIRPPLMAGLIVVGLSVLQTQLKSIIPRTYPMGGKDVLFARGDAYPSGHTLNGFVLVWTVLELLVLAFPGVHALSGRLSARGRFVIAVVTGFITAVALTLADVHWLTDVLASLGLGTILLDLLERADPFRTRAPAQAGLLRADVGSPGWRPGTGRDDPFTGPGQAG